MKPIKALGRAEFIALMAMLAATVAFSIDAMLPALSEIAQELTPGNLNRAQLVITSFIFGMGLGTLFAGPLSDAFGRKPIVLVGAAIYSVAAVLAWSAQSLEMLLFARALQGIGASGPRVIFSAMVRDLYSGRDMARISSIVMVIFTLVPALAPMLGNGIIHLFGWRTIFVAFILFGLIGALWLQMRQPETLPPERRRSLRPSTLLSAAREVLSKPVTRNSIAMQTMIMGMLFTVLSSTQPIFETSYGFGASFPYWFGGIAVIAGTAGIVNARLVMTLGMRRIIRASLSVQVVLSMIALIVFLLDLPFAVSFPVYLIWTTSIFFQTGMTMGNLNALAMEPVGHIAGLATSLITAISTVGAVIIAAPIGQMFDGTPMPIAAGLLVVVIVARLIATRLDRGAPPQPGAAGQPSR